MLDDDAEVEAVTGGYMRTFIAEVTRVRGRSESVVQRVARASRVSRISVRMV